MWQKIKRPVQVAVSLALLGGLLLFVDIRDTLTTLGTADISLLLIAFLLTVFNRCLMGFKWWLLLRVKGIPESLSQAIRIYFISSFLGLYMPPTIGADSVRAYYVARRGNSLKDCLSSILVERLLGLIAVSLFALVGVVLMLRFYSASADGLGYAPAIIVAITLSIVAGFFASLDRRFKTMASRLALAPRGKLRGLTSKLYRLYESYFGFRDHPGTLFTFFILTCFEVCLPIIRAYLVSTSLGLSVSPAYFFAFVPIILILIRLPISIDGFGLQEGGFLYFLALVGIPEDAGFSVGLLNHLLFLLALLPGGVLYLFAPNVRKDVNAPPT